MTSVTTQVDVLEIVASPRSTTEIIESSNADLVEVRTDGAVLSVERPATDVLQVVTAGPIGPRGPIGPERPQGPFAPIFEQHFASPLIEWVINHNLGVFPVVTLYDLNFEEITGDVMTPDKNTVIVDFMVPFAGTARLKA